MLKLLRFGIKAGITVSAVYLTIDNGVWKDSETTSKLYNELTTKIGQYANPYVEMVPFPEIPRTGSLVGTVQATWNTSVKASCKFLAASPKCAVGYVKQGYQYVSDQIQAATTE